MRHILTLQVLVLFVVVSLGPPFVPLFSFGLTLCDVVPVSKKEIPQFFFSLFFTKQIRERTQQPIFEQHFCCRILSLRRRRVLTTVPDSSILLFCVVGSTRPPPGLPPLHTRRSSASTSLAVTVGPTIQIMNPVSDEHLRQLVWFTGIACFPCSLLLLDSQMIKSLTKS